MEHLAKTYAALKDRLPAGIWEPEDLAVLADGRGGISPLRLLDSRIAKSFIFTEGRRSRGDRRFRNRGDETPEEGELLRELLYDCRTKPSQNFLDAALSLIDAGLRSELSLSGKALEDSLLLPFRRAMDKGTAYFRRREGRGSSDLYELVDAHFVVHASPRVAETYLAFATKFYGLSLMGSEIIELRRRLESGKAGIGLCAQWAALAEKSDRMAELGCTDFFGGVDAILNRLGMRDLDLFRNISFKRLGALIYLLCADSDRGAEPASLGFGFLEYVLSSPGIRAVSQPAEAQCSRFEAFLGALERAPLTAYLGEKGFRSFSEEAIRRNGREDFFASPASRNNGELRKLEGFYRTLLERIGSRIPRDQREHRLLAAIAMSLGNGSVSAAFLGLMRYLPAMLGSGLLSDAEVRKIRQTLNCLRLAALETPGRMPDRDGSVQAEGRGGLPRERPATPGNGTRGMQASACPISTDLFVEGFLWALRDRCGRSDPLRFGEFFGALALRKTSADFFALLVPYAAGREHLTKSELFTTYQGRFDVAPGDLTRIHRKFRESLRGLIREAMLYSGVARKFLADSHSAFRAWLRANAWIGLLAPYRLRTAVWERDPLFGAYCASQRLPRSEAVFSDFRDKINEALTRVEGADDD